MCDDWVAEFVPLLLVFFAGSASAEFAPFAWFVWESGCVYLVLSCQPQIKNLQKNVAERCIEMRVMWLFKLYTPMTSENPAQRQWNESRNVPDLAVSLDDFFPSNFLRVYQNDFISLFSPPNIIANACKQHKNNQTHTEGKHPQPLAVRTK